MITFTLNDKQADQVLSALAQRPYFEVYQLIAELLQQAKVPPVVTNNGDEELRRQAKPWAPPTPDAADVDHED